MFRSLLLFCAVLISAPLAAGEAEELALLKAFARDNALTNSQVEAGKKAIADGEKFVARVDALIARYRNLAQEAENERRIMVSSLKSSLVRATQVQATLKRSCTNSGGEPCSHLKVSTRKISDLKGMLKSLGG